MLAVRLESLLASLPSHLPEERTTVLLHSRSLRVERIVSLGHHSPTDFWYEQADAEWVLVVAGQARLEFEEGPPVEMKAGDYVNIPARCRHRVAWTDPNEPTVWLAIFYCQEEAESAG